MCFNRLNEEARKLFEELGSSSIKLVGFRDNWVFVGAKGITKKSTFEKVNLSLILVLSSRSKVYIFNMFNLVQQRLRI